MNQLLIFDQMKTGLKENPQKRKGTVSSSIYTFRHFSDDRKSENKSHIRQSVFVVMLLSRGFVKCNGIDFIMKDLVSHIKLYKLICDQAFMRCGGSNDESLLAGFI